MSPFLATAFTVLCIIISLMLWTKDRFLPLKIPIAFSNRYPLEKRIKLYTFNSREILIEAYKEFRSQVFGLNTSEGVNCIIPSDFLDDLKSHKALSFAATLEDVAQTQYTSIGGLPDFVVKLMVRNLNPTLEWKKVKVYPTMLRLVARISARVFHSSDASENEEWISLSTAYVEAVIPYAQKLKAWPTVLRPFVWRYIPGYASLRRQREQARQIIAETLRKKQDSGGKDMENPPSMLDYTSSGKHADMIDNLEDQFLLQLSLVVAGVHTSAATITQSLFDLAVQPDLVRELQEEVHSAPRAIDGLFTKTTLLELPKLDSFIKEVQRFNSADLTTFQRKAIHPLTLPNGIQIPKGTKLELATGALNLDDQIWENASTFDGLRFYKMRRVNEEEERKHKFISVSKRELAWGYGRHACPGRWLAEVVIKSVLAQFLVSYDLKNPDGQNRWESIAIDGQILPNSEGEVFVRKQ